MTIQATLVAGKNGRFLGQSMTSASFTNDLPFNYPTSQQGDLIIAYLVASNLLVPTLDSGWTTLYSNTTAAVNASGSGRLLAYKRRGTESSANAVVSGGGTCTCVALRGYLGTIADVAEFTANSSIGNTSFSKTINSGQVLLTMVNMDGGFTNPVITIANTTASFHSEPGYFKSMGIGYNLGVANDPVSVNIASENAYGVYLTVF